MLKAGWEIKKLPDLCENLDGKRIPITKSKRANGDIPYYGASGVVDYVAESIFDDDLLLVSEDGANLLARTYPISFSISGKSWVNNHAHVLRFDSITTQRFVEYYLNSIPLEPYVSGMAQPKLNKKSLNSIAIPIPPLPEQTRIVAILDEAFANISQAVANAEKNLANARELFDSYLNEVFTRKGEGWEEERLSSLCQEITVGHVGSMVSQYKDNGIIFLRSQNIQAFDVNLNNIRFIDDDFHASLKKSSLKPGDVAIVRTGYPGTAAVIPRSIPVANCSDIVIVRVKEKLNPHYLVAVMNSDFGKRSVGLELVGAAQKHFNVSAAKNMLIPLPDRSTQEKIVSNVYFFRGAIEELEDVYRRKLAALAELKQALLQKAFTGEL